MHEYDRMYFRMSQAPKMTPVVKALLLINIVMFAGQVFSPLPLVKWLGLTPRVVNNGWLWQIVTYMFLHSEAYLFHVIFNLLMLYWFGRDIEMNLGSRRFVRFYLCAGLVAALIYTLTEFIIRGRGSAAIGASGAIMAVMVLYAIFYPRRQLLFMFLFPMKVRTFVLLMIGVDLYIVFQAAEASNVAAIAHLGGAGYGLAYYQFSPLVGKWIQGFIERREQGEEQDKFNSNRRLDEILDKVNKMGIQSLTRREKKFLKDVSENIDKLKKR